MEFIKAQEEIFDEGHLKNPIVCISRSALIKNGI